MENLLKYLKLDLKTFLNMFENDSYTRDIELALYEYFWRDMPYGIATADDGDPTEFITERIMQMLNDDNLLNPVKCSRCEMFEFDDIDRFKIGLCHNCYSDLNEKI